MSSPTGSSQWFANPGSSFYNDVATTSLRFNDSDDANLKFDPSGAGNRKTWTCSAWVKKTNIGNNTDGGNDRYIFNTFTAGNNANCAVMGFRSDKLFYSTYGVEVLVANQLQRDTSAWFNVQFVLDTTQAVAANRLKIYLNGNQITSFSVDNRANAYLNQNEDLAINNGNEVRVGDAGASGARQNMAGYLSDVNFIDGLALTPSSFGELKNGVWIPKNTSGLTFGTNGFRLKFDQVGVGTASTSTIGADTSGNNNHFTSTNIVVSDCAMPDSPENNFATWNTIYRMYGDTGSLATTEGGLFVTGGGNVNSDRAYAMSTIPVNEILRNEDGAGVYMEVRSPSVGGDNGYIGLLGQSRFDQKGDSATVRSDNSGHGHYHLISPNGRTLLESGESSSSALAGLNGAPTDNAVIGFAVKSDGKFFISVDGTFSTNAAGAAQNPVTGANPMGTIDLTVDFFFHAGNISLFQANFGQDSTFAGNETATSNADANGIGAFHGAVPTGYLAMCTSNMPEPTIGPNSLTSADDHFETVLYEGNGSTQNIAVNFKPDWTWIKNRDATDDYQIFDSNRGVTKVIESNTNAAEAANDDTLTAFIATGFSLGDDVTVNTNNESYVAWNWKANGGTATATISESGDNPAAVVQANPTAGFSLITYTGTGAVGTIAHGLGVAPKWMLIKRRDGTDHWAVFHFNTATDPATDYFELNRDVAVADAASLWNDVAPTSSVFTIGTDGYVNADGAKYVAYIFAEVQGFSKFDSYIANNSTDGTFLHMGFSPAWVLIKQTGTNGWVLFDSKRNILGWGQPANPMAGLLLTSTTNVEGNANLFVDFLSNGMKMRIDSGYLNNGAGTTFLYMAFADIPFKYANAR